MTDLRATLSRIRYHQAGVLFDTNVLLLLLMHRAAPRYVGDWKRTRQFREAHADVVARVFELARAVVVTPHVLAEVTNLSNDIPPGLHRAYWDELREFIRKARERSVPAALACQEGDFERLGLADVTMTLLRRSTPFVVTVDGPLTLRLERRGTPHMNVNHFVFEAA